ncbi:MAG: PaaI family thioesterase [Acidobacteriota bacterium]|nr:PaaI family thioesterase [Acidobacteriota bacterium]
MGQMAKLVEALAQGRLPMPPVAVLIGFRIQSAEADRVVMVLEAGPQHANPMGTIHGGILCDIADAAMAMAYATGSEDGTTLTTLDLNISFLRPFWTGRLRAVGRVVKRGGTTGLAECDVLDDQDRLIARATSTLMTLAGEQGKGR